MDKEMIGLQGSAYSAKLAESDAQKKGEKIKELMKLNEKLKDDLRKALSALTWGRIGE